MINEVRADAGAPLLVLGTNDAAQIHAEYMLEHCYVGHWTADGQTGDMRYVLAGGYQATGENVQGAAPSLSNFDCEPWSHRSTFDRLAKIQELVDGFNDSPGHRRTMVKPGYRKVNIGLAYNRVAIFTVNQYEKDYVSFVEKPQINGFILSMEGNLNNAVISPAVPSIYFAPYPSHATVEQLRWASCVSDGNKVGLISRELKPGEDRAERQAYLDSDPKLRNPSELLSGLPTWRDSTSPSLPPKPYVADWIISDIVDPAETSYFQAQREYREAAFQARPRRVHASYLWGQDEPDSTDAFTVVEYPIFYQGTEPDWPLIHSCDHLGQALSRMPASDPHGPEPFLLSVLLSAASHTPIRIRPTLAM